MCVSVSSLLTTSLSWYRSHELAHRIAILYSGVALANAFGGLIAAGVLHNLSPAHGIAGWRWLFIIEGTATVGIALIAVLVIFPCESLHL